VSIPSLRQHSAGLSFKIHVQPKSSRNRIAGLRGDALKINLTAPPVEGAANTMCVRYLAECLGLPRSAVAILSGHSSRTKHLLVCCDPADRERLAARIESLVPT
jgi:hypothetical protein